MTLFDLLFLLAALATVLSLLAALLCALIGRRSRALGILKAWGVAAALYLAADLASLLTTSLSVIHLHDPQCADDWCFVVEKAARDAPDSEIYRVDLRIYSRALRVEQRERGLALYLQSPDGRRYDPVPQPGDVPFDTLLQPGQSAAVARAFRIPATVHRLDLYMVQSGNFPIGRLIIGRSPYDGRTAVRLD